MNKLLIVSHCILNTASKVVSYQPEEMEEESRNRERLLDYAIKNQIQLIQLPCPEFMLYGYRRWGHVKNQFDHSFFRKQSREMLAPIILQLKEYTSCPERFQVLAIIAIDGSPSCGYHKTCKGDWGGEFSGCPDLSNKLSQIYCSDESGVFMEELIKFLKEEKLMIPIKDLSEFVSSYVN